ncbi:BTB domain-containing protein [Mycena indigotica]|uniref:BTB domain-containing protein n=1 Tax=Mycena indigotica TaxID=2126181 RepID=A0A8H6RYN7_9AGAR|nr:BTB domain-containing protein [Mycena indigotica]KAF7289297.1 BTB domain-containing protein [Mycena indigotica]
MLNPPIPYEHPRFYFRDGNVIFKVEDTLYRVHRYFFDRDSVIFSSMFTLPPGAGQRPEGETPESPILLEGVKKLDFDRFLTILYPSNFLTRDTHSAIEWTSVLSLATRWDFVSLRTLAITKLAALTSSISPAERIAIARAYDIQEWLAPAFFTLCTRAEALTLAEGRCLGLDDSIRVGQVRQAIRYASNLNRHPDSIADFVQEMFALPVNTT